MKVIVTQEMIDAGIAKNCKQCPLAVAFTATLGYPVEIGMRTGCVTKNNRTTVFNLTKEMQNFIARFDYGQRVEPCEFDFQEAVL